jgi:hypothetical protein
MRSLNAPGNFFDTAGASAPGISIKCEAKCIFWPNVAGCRAICLSAAVRRAPSLSASGMAKPSILPPLEFTLRGGAVARERCSCCSLWKTCSKKTQFGFMTWATMGSTNNILPTKAIRKLSSGFSPDGCIPAWRAAFSVHATRLRSALAPRWNSFISNHELGNFCGVDSHFGFVAPRPGVRNSSMAALLLRSRQIPDSAGCPW